MGEIDCGCSSTIVKWARGSYTIRFVAFLPPLPVVVSAFRALLTSFNSLFFELLLLLLLLIGVEVAESICN